MRKILVQLTFAGFLLSQPVQAVTVYVYDSLVGKGSLGNQLKEAYERETKDKVTFVEFNTAGEVLAHFLFESKKGSSSADVLLGLDQVQMSKAVSSGLFQPLSTELYRNLVEDVSSFTHQNSYFLPFDYGYLSFLYHAANEVKYPFLSEKTLSLKNFLASSQINKKIALQDPRTSSIGLSFLAYTKIVFNPSDYQTIWKNISEKALSITPGWYAAYELFLKGEVDFVLSYTTSPAYHIEHKERHQVKAISFAEGLYQQTEGAMIPKSAKNAKQALNFLKVLVSKEIQSKLPTLNWMYPVAKGVTLPKSFEKLLRPGKIIKLPAEVTAEDQQKWLDDWNLSFFQKN